jgi:hypothetical protein
LENKERKVANIKYAPMEQLSCWLEYRLVTDKLDPPVFRCRLRPVTGLNLVDGYEEGEKLKLGKMTLEVAIEAVAEWDLANEGVPIPLTSENKTGMLIPIIDAQLEGQPEGHLLGVAILMDAKRRENFLKN